MEKGGQSDKSDIDLGEEQAKKKQRRPRPNWSKYLKDRHASLHDAVALSLNISPVKIDILLNDSKTKIGAAFRARAKAARLEMHVGGFIVVVEEGDLADGLDWVVELKSFVSFAIARDWGKNQNFLRLGTVSPLDNFVEPVQKLECKTPVKFIASFIQMLVEIAKRAEKAGQEFNVDSLPGQKIDLHELGRQLDREMACKESTFSTYIKGLCKFKQGAKRDDFYKNLFPDLFKK